jgi:NADH-quinone oxidoreductase subunit J
VSELAGAPSGGLSAVVFWVAAVAAVAGALATILSRRAIRSAVFLLGNILSLAILFALLDAHLLAALQVIVYAGAVVVLFVFVIMLLGSASESRGTTGRAPVVRAVAGASLAWVGWVTLRAVVGVAPEAALPEGFGTVHALALAIFEDNVFTFEAMSVLLLVAIVGAVAVAKGKRVERRGPPGAGAGPDVQSGEPT